MRTLILVFFMLMTITIFTAIAQPPDSLWSRTFGGSGYENAEGVQQTTDGGYIIAGSTASYGVGGLDFWLVKTDANGDTLWTRTFGGGGVDGARDVKQTNDGGYILGGATESYGAGSFDFWLVKTDSLGVEQWNRTFGGFYWEGFQTVHQTSDGGYILGGFTSSFGAGSEDFWLVKTDSSGNEQWNRTFGGGYNDCAFNLQQTMDGGYILVGQTYSFGAGDADFWMVKTDSLGVEQWSRTFGGISGDHCYSVQQTSDGGYILAGETWSFGAGNNDFWLVKTDSAGTELWNRTYGGSDWDSGISVQQTSDGGYVLAGWTNSFGAGSTDFWLVKTDSNGNSFWSRTFGGSLEDRCYSVQQTSDGGYIMAGPTQSFGAGYADFWLVKMGYIIPPVINSITDVGNDQGRQVRLRWNRCIYDGLLPDYVITGYSIYRRIDQYLDSGMMGPGYHGLDWPPG